MMGEVVQFPDPGVVPITVWHDEPPVVLILPVIRIERCLELPLIGIRTPDDEPPGPRRRRR